MHSTHTSTYLAQHNFHIPSIVYLMPSNIWLLGQYFFVYQQQSNLAYIMYEYEILLNIYRDEYNNVSPVHFVPWTN